LLDLLQIILREDRRLSRLDFERAWEKATSVTVPLSMARLIGASPMSTSPDYNEFALDALPKRLSMRGATVTRLAAIVQFGAIPWIHGSSGLGKSRLATLLAGQVGGIWHIVRLRGLSASELGLALRQASATLDRPDLCGIILDDLPMPLVEPWRRYIRPIASEAARLGLALVITGERAPLAPTADDFAPWQLELVTAPYLDVAEVSDIVRSAQGDPDFWAPILHITCGAGHPLFIDARIAGLASRGWPQEERLAGLLSDGQVAELNAVRESVALRLLRNLTQKPTHSCCGLVFSWGCSIVNW
jgi:hypothetical protein